MSLAYDENGRPFIILREQEKKKRVKGLEAHKVSSQTNLWIFEQLYFLTLKVAFSKIRKLRERVLLTCPLYRLTSWLPALLPPF